MVGMGKPPPSASCYQRLLARAEEADKLMELRRSIAQYRSGRVRSIEDALSELEERHAGAAKHGCAHRAK